MVQLIIEAGTSKTDIALINGSIQERRQFGGLNPLTSPHFDQLLQEMLVLFTGVAIDKVYYYGSGCINAMTKAHIKQLIKDSLQTTISIEVDDDLIGAARALCGHSPGIIGILGTGSNTAYYDGHTLVSKVNSGGHLLGDEGSGHAIGKEIYKRYARGQLNRDEMKVIHKDLGISQQDAIVRLYQASDPRTFLAQKSKLISLLSEVNKDRILSYVFSSWCDNCILPINESVQEDVYLTGSIAWHFQSAIRKILRKNNIIAASIIKAPLGGLIHYHHEGKRH